MASILEGMGCIAYARYGSSRTFLSSAGDDLAKAILDPL